MKGYLNLVLHGHLPFVINHGRWPHGSDWLFEATAETYLPLLQTLEYCEKKELPIRFTMGITPVLMEQLADERFPPDFMNYIDQKVDAAVDDRDHFARLSDDHREALSEMWIDFFSDVGRYFEKIDGDIIGEFVRHHKAGRVELMTCGATHGYLPLLGTDESVRAQIQVAKQTYRRHVGEDPKGIWLPEAAYRPSYEWKRPAGPDRPAFKRRGVEEFLYEAGIKYFFVDSHLLRGGEAVGVYIDRFRALKDLWAQFESHYQTSPEKSKRTPYKPYLTSSTGGKNAVGFFTRDPETCLQVWSGEWGYPGNGAYLDFHKKHFPGGHRYWRVTDSEADLADKKLYDPAKIDKILGEQAFHFVSLADKIIQASEKKADGQFPPIITAPFDAELFGHWWFEGPRWFEKVIENIANNKNIDLTTGWKYMKENPPGDIVQLPEGSWGQGGFHYIWLNDWTKWTWEHIYEDEDRMVELAKKYEKGADANTKRLLNQLGRELLLLESSDWQFLISTWSARDYAENRIAFHHEQFRTISKLIDKLSAEGSISDGDWQYINDLEEQDSLFPNIDYRFWLPIEKLDTDK
ncbi:MAG: glycoside hydrolase family 57 protein [Candidatus Zixiibacteriota bacterium]